MACAAGIDLDEQREERVHDLGLDCRACPRREMFSFSTTKGDARLGEGVEDGDDLTQRRLTEPVEFADDQAVAAPEDAHQLVEPAALFGSLSGMRSPAFKRPARRAGKTKGSEPYGCRAPEFSAPSQLVITDWDCCPHVGTVLRARAPIAQENTSIIDPEPAPCQARGRSLRSRGSRPCPRQAPGTWQQLALSWSPD